jgi:predicted methyltransferase
MSNPMSNPMKRPLASSVPMSLALVLLCAVAPAAVAQQGPQLQSEAARSVQAWVTRPERTPEQRAEDSYRKPALTLDFFGLQPDMKVVEFFPGGGYYSEIIANGLGSSGQLLLVGPGSNNAARIKDATGKTVTAIADSALVMGRVGNGSPWFNMEKFDLGMTDVDMFITVRNLHDYTQETRHVIHEGVFKSLKSGGIYAIEDHTKRHNDPGNAEIWRRVDPVQMIKEVEAAGFRFVDYSNLHYRPDDSLEFDTTRPSINRYSDRFTLKFSKP